MLKKCPKKFVLSENDMSEGKVVRLGLSAMSAKANEAENEKKLVKCFLCHGQHRLRKCPKKSAIGLDDGLDKVPKKLSLSTRGVESKRSKRSKKKRVKYFWCRCPYELRNCPKQFKLVVVKEKTTSKLVESSKGLLPKEEVILASNLEEEVAMETLKLGPMRLNSRKTTEFSESSARLPPKEVVNYELDLKEEVVMQTLNLGSMRLISVHSSDELLPIGGKNVTGHSSKSVTIVQNASHGGLSFKWGSFDPRELA
ncbi:hypothetical protein Goari_013922 [Gossypium aridum]|uniref:Uncharacterized protein n=1 Tax=Gossypium aridum TaxID=34290 RepID=A0A7J8XGC2_GOSAI|nr:hypothetical protein [Gossypium aridum]